MTCIAVKKEKDYIHLVADSSISIGRRNKVDTSQKKMMKDYSKIEKVNEIYFGLSGSCEDALVFKSFIKLNNPKSSSLSDMEEYVIKFYDHCKKRNSNWDNEPQIIIVYKGNVFFVWGYLIYEVNEYEAIGSGMYYARTALYLGKPADVAVDVAIEFAGGVGGYKDEVKIKTK